jgi:hypothetical protein
MLNSIMLVKGVLLDEDMSDSDKLVEINKIVFETFISLDRMGSNGRDEDDD